MCIHIFETILCDSNSEKALYTHPFISGQLDEFSALTSTNKAYVRGLSLAEFVFVSMHLLA